MKCTSHNQGQKLILMVTFYPGKRQNVPSLNGSIYRPHLVVKGTEEYLGVCFQEGSIAAFNTPCKVHVSPIYSETIDYTALQAGTEFLIMEGAVAVGEGIVLQ